MPVKHPLGAVAAALGASALALVACRGCASESDAPAVRPDDGGTEVDVRRDALTDPKHDLDTANDPASDSPPDAVVEHEGVPPGWVQWTGWSAACPIYIPGPGAELPPPIEWEPCPDAVHSQASCIRMKDTWGGSSVSIFTRLWRDPESGIPLLKFARPVPALGIQLVPFIIAEADGKVRHAQLYPLTLGTSDCDYFSEDFNDGLYVIDAPLRLQAGSDSGTSTIDGVIGGPMSVAAPSVLAQTNENSDWRVSKIWLVQLTLGKVNAWTWDGKLSHNVYAGGTDPNGLQPHVPLVIGKDIFLPVGNLQLCGVMSWTPDAGLRPLLRWYSDPTRAAGNFGTDGKVMVWTQSQGTGACHNDGPNPEVWTAPYTTDPAVLQATAKRVRKDVRGMSAETFVVGEGYAARCDSFGSPARHSLSIVRLSDGYSWVLPGDPEHKTHAFAKTLGIAGGEVYVHGAVEEMSSTIFRIRLDSLGPGTAPD